MSKNMIDKMKSVFTPTEFINMNTGEVIKRRQLKTLSEEEKQDYIKADEFEILSQTYPQSNITENIRKKKDIKPKKIKQNIRKQNKPNVSKSNSLGLRKQKEDKPPKAPRKIEKQVAKNMQEEPPVIDSIEALKKRLSELHRKSAPFFDLTSHREYLIQIVEDTELSTEDETIYYEYLKEHEGEIAELINQIEWRASKQEEIEARVTQLATLLNMGSLSMLQAERLGEVLESWSYTNGE